MDGLSVKGPLFSCVPCSTSVWLMTQLTPWQVVCVCVWFISMLNVCSLNEVVTGWRAHQPPYPSTHLTWTLKPGLILNVKKRTRHNVLKVLQMSWQCRNVPTVQKCPRLHLSRSVRIQLDSVHESRLRLLLKLDACFMYCRFKACEVVTQTVSLFTLY